MLRNNRLKEFLPRTGMVFPSANLVLGVRRKDTRVMKAFEVANFAEVRGGPTKTAKAAVDQALAETFTLALDPQIFKHLTTKGKGLFDFLGALKKAVPWAGRVGESTFIKLCQCLVDARLAWKASPRPPFDINQHCATARSIDVLLEAAGGRWSSAMFEIYEIVGGFNEDEDEDEDVEGDEVEEEKGEQETSQAGLPSSSADPSSSSVDIQMTDLAAALEEDLQEEELRQGFEEMDLDG
ncbi:hypothetical protein M434DRAFT_15496 [Hypoxylon sp. CO27-5]|nr:hypothetical protein M434DRAFT_15496 [Hypoxylon sp. CO27-5]